ncbi:type II/IV secretion system protein [Mesorhizobium sp. B1-1-4]|uniref:GspE/PulE family protein n=1 Tax=Mesorhizobium sp. B1-1-4 TaxID=2589980 RepID=UPI00112E702E|nr:GspE/PulE family protein [Mesorhizobium sp. B1-1-4]TPN45881.1 type II/IV secretion system protein [Mesorhizobium sp. B1-1-4]
MRKPASIVLKGQVRQVRSMNPQLTDLHSLLSSMAGAGLASREATRGLFGESTASRASDLHRLIEAQIVDADALAGFLSSYYGVRLLDRHQLADYRPVGQNLSNRFLVENWIAPLTAPDGSAVIGVLHPGDADPIEALRSVLDGDVEVCVVPAPDLESCLERLSGTQDVAQATGEGATSEAAIASLRDLASGAPVVVVVDDIFRRALDLRATDIHLEPMRGRLVMRFRIDGVLRIMPPPPHEMGDAIVSRIKVLAGLDITERRKPQDGAMRLPIGDREVELRVATLSSIHGETVVMRILHRDSVLLDFAGVGLDDQERQTLDRLLEHTHGMIAVAGPTGSGKTTTLAAALSKLNDPGRKIVTIEDPVEYQIPGIVQSQINSAIGITFSSAIRTFVRQDPDVILVGEIRDGETARAAVQAALTGHLVLTTVHANTAAAAFTRMRDLGVETYLLVGAVRGIISQRLLRRLCDHCKQEGILSTETFSFDSRYQAVGFSQGQKIFNAVGCGRCNGAGYRGRIAVFEVLVLDEAIIELASQGADHSRIEALALERGMSTMAHDGARKAGQGLTSPAEVLRVTGFR